VSWRSGWRLSEPVREGTGRSLHENTADTHFVAELKARAELFNRDLFNRSLPLAKVEFLPSAAVRQLGSVRTNRDRSVFVMRIARLLDGPAGERPVEGSRFNLRDEVLIHELVHVEQFIQAPNEPPHGPWFLERMRSIGARPRACPTVQLKVRGRWLYRDPAGHEVVRLRRYGRRRVSCRRCDPRAYNPRHRLRLVGEITSAGGAE